MAYQNNYVLSIINNNRPVREFAEDGERTCIVPFGSEYKIRLKNKSTKRAKAKVYLDGMEVLSSGGYFILDAGETLDLERFVDDNESGNRFKFISVEQGMKTGEVQDPTNSENGKITVEFYEEIVFDYDHFTTTVWSGTSDTTDTAFFTNSTTTNVNSTTLGDVTTSFTNTAGGQSVTNCCPDSFSKVVKKARRINKDIEKKAKKETTAGVTSQGSSSSQKFVEGVSFATSGIPTTITISLRGPTSNVEKPQSAWTVKFAGKQIVVYFNGTEFHRSSRNSTVKIDGPNLFMKEDPVRM